MKFEEEEDERTGPRGSFSYYDSEIRRRKKNYV